MLYSEDRKFVFVAVPKTGTTAVQKRLCEVDPGIRRNTVHDAEGRLVNVPTHATALEIRKIMGAERARQVKFVAFLRDPRDVLVSKYHFYRSGRVARMQGLAPQGAGESIRFHPGKIARVLFAKALPLTVWARLYPFKSCSHFVTDGQGRLIVDMIGRAEALQDEVDRVFSAFGYAPEQLVLGVSNRTEYDRSATRDPRIEVIVARRLPEDCALFKSLVVEKTLA